METKLTFESVMQGFEEMRKRWLSKADKVLETYKGCDTRILHMGEKELEEIALDAAKWIEDAGKGCYPRESLTILADVMRQLVQKKYELKLSTEKEPLIPVADYSFIELRDDFALTAN